MNFNSVRSWEWFGRRDFALEDFGRRIRFAGFLSAIEEEKDGMNEGEKGREREREREKERERGS